MSDTSLGPVIRAKSKRRTAMGHKRAEQMDVSRASLDESWHGLSGQVPGTTHDYPPVLWLWNSREACNACRWGQRNFFAGVCKTLRVLSPRFAGQGARMYAKCSSPLCCIRAASILLIPPYAQGGESSHLSQYVVCEDGKRRVGPKFPRG